MTPPPPPLIPTMLTTVQDLITLYETVHLSSLAQPASTRTRLRRYFSTLRPLPLAALTVPTIQAWANSIRPHSRTQADGSVKLLRAMINFAIRSQLWTGTINPAEHVLCKPPSARSRYILDAEVPSFIRECEREPVFIRLYFYLEFFTGPRPGEVERMKRQHVKLLRDGSACWFKPQTKTTEHRIMLPFSIPDLLAKHLAVLSPATDYLFPARNLVRHLSHEFWHARWTEIRDRAGLQDVQLRDLRRTCATRLLDRGMDLISLSKGVLNHSNLTTTKTYARPTLERVGQHLDAHMQHTLSRAGVQPYAPQLLDDEQ
jgi:integrase